MTSFWRKPKTKEKHGTTAEEVLSIVKSTVAVMIFHQKMNRYTYSTSHLAGFIEVPSIDMIEFPLHQTALLWKGDIAKSIHALVSVA